MRFNPSFIQLFSSLEEANDFSVSPDNANPFRTWLRFCPKEVYNQYIALDYGYSNILEFREIIKAELVDIEGAVINPNLGFGYRKYLEQNVLLISFKILQDYGDQCLAIKLTFNGGFSNETGFSQTANNIIYSNIFTCSEYNRERTSLVTYKHLENHYEIPYNASLVLQQQKTSTNALAELAKQEQQRLYNQIRLPLYFHNWKTEQDSSEATYATNTPVNINVSRVKRRSIKKWRVVANDWINERLAIVSDSDYVYINTQREITRPYEYEEVDNGGDFSLSFLESQPKYGDNYVDNNGYVNHKPEIINITFPNGPCCNPSEDPLIEPEIINEQTLASGCAFQGVLKRITVQGQPGAIIKYRLTAQVIQGTAKQVRVYNANFDNNHTFSNTSQVFVGYFGLDNTGQAIVNLKCCLEECTPGVPVRIDSTFELYQMDGTTLSGEICEVDASKTCPLPAAPVWQILSQTGTQFKNVRISGEPNTQVGFQVRVLSELSSSHYFPKNMLRVEGYLNQDDVSEDDTWNFTANLNSSGLSQDFDIECNAGNYMGLGTLESYIYVSFTLRNYDGTLSTQVVGIHDIHRRP